MQQEQGMMQGPGGGQLGMHEQGMLQQVASGPSRSQPAPSSTPLSYSSCLQPLYIDALETRTSTL